MQDAGESLPAAEGAGSSKATGPRTAEGKAASSKNATKHGIHARPTEEELAAARRRFADPREAPADRTAVVSRTLVVFERARSEKARLLTKLAACVDPWSVAQLLAALQRVDEYERKARSRLTKDLAPLRGAPAAK